MLKRILKYWAQFSCIFLMMLNTAHAAGGGVSLGATRLIYDQDKKNASMAVINSTTDKRYLINAWVEDIKGTKVDNILVTPPMFVSEAKSENSLRILNTDQNLPRDRETLFYLNVQSIPSVSRVEDESQNVLQLAILSRIKMMIRPNKLPIRVEDAVKMISVEAAPQGTLIKNPTPYYQTLVYIELDGKKNDTVMLEPFSEHLMKLSGRTLKFKTINDYGAFTDTYTLQVK